MRPAWVRGGGLQGSTGETGWVGRFSKTVLGERPIGAQETDPPQALEVNGHPQRDVRARCGAAVDLGVPISGRGCGAQGRERVSRLRAVGATVVCTGGAPAWPIATRVRRRPRGMWREARWGHGVCISYGMAGQSVESSGTPSCPPPPPASCEPQDWHLNPIQIPPPGPTRHPRASPFGGGGYGYGHGHGKSPFPLHAGGWQGPVGHEQWPVVDPLIAYP